MGFLDLGRLRLRSVWLWVLTDLREGGNSLRYSWVALFIPKRTADSKTDLMNSFISTRHSTSRSSSWGSWKSKVHSAAPVPASGRRQRSVNLAGWAPSEKRKSRYSAG